MASGHKEEDGAPRWVGVGVGGGVILPHPESRRGGQGICWSCGLWHLAILLLIFRSYINSTTVVF